MKFKLRFDIPDSGLQLDAHSKIVFLGSCFADNISQKMEDLQLQVYKNPFGTIFHPIPIAAQINKAIKADRTVNVLKRGDVYLDWLSSSKIAAPSEQELIDNVQGHRKSMRSFLAQADLLVVSFGTAWGYALKDQLQTVGNCHKQPSTGFVKKLSEVDEMFTNWKQLLQDLYNSYPSLKIVFTVSPVRHVKDGLVENNRSKARLLELVHRLCEESNAIYFPAYEVLMDELRDYRFYSEDLVHPNHIAVDYIFNKFIDFAYSQKGKEQLSEVSSYINLRDHRVIHEFSEEEQKRQIKLKALQDQIRTVYPWME